VSSSSGSTNGNPWPEPDEADVRAEAERLGRQAAELAEDLDTAGDRVADHLDDIDDHIAEWDRRTETTGSRGVALAVAGMNVGAMLILPVLLVVGVYTFITIYAIVKAVSEGSDQPDALTIMLGVVGLVTLFVTLLGVGGWLIGRAADPKKRR
jgi:sirohydrochlorin ferrochelatase